MKPDLKKLKELRKENNETLKDMAELLGYQSLYGYYYIESEKSNMTLEQAKVLADHFGIAVDSLFFEKDVALKATSKKRKARKTSAEQS